ncbi:MAG: AtpZ/AtpI family protein [Terriglobales bacterium]
MKGLQFIGLGLLLPAGAFVGLALGYLLDRHWGTGKIFELAGMALGLAGGFLQLYREAFRK